jgi:hypothetical protein
MRVPGALIYLNTARVMRCTESEIVARRHVVADLR